MKIILMALAIIGLSSCDYSRTSGGQPPTGPQSSLTDPGNPGEEPTVRFADVKSTVFDSSCMGCHQNKNLVLNFADYANTKSFAAEILVRVFEVRDMPPRNKLTALQEQVLRSWLDAGAPE